METIQVRRLISADRAAWEPLWTGYQVFYKADLPPEITNTTWQRFMAPAEPMYALGRLRMPA